MVGAAVLVLLAEMGDGGGIEIAGLGEGGGGEGVFGPGGKLLGAPPGGVGGGESFFRPFSSGFRQVVCHCFSEEEFVLAGPEFEVGRQLGAKFPQTMIQKRWTSFNRGSHAHAVYFEVDEIDHAGLGFESDELVEGVGIGLIG